MNRPDARNKKPGEADLKNHSKAALGPLKSKYILGKERIHYSFSCVL